MKKGFWFPDFYDPIDDFLSDDSPIHLSVEEALKFTSVDYNDGQFLDLSVRFPMLPARKRQLKKFKSKFAGKKYNGTHWKQIKKNEIS